MKVKGILDEIKRNWMFSAILSIVLGAVLLFFPGISIKLVCFLLGGISIVYGAGRIVRYFREGSSYPEIFRGDLMFGLFGVAIGLFMFFKSSLVVSLIPTVFGIVLMASGIGSVQRAADAQRAGYSKWGVMLGLAILSIVIGILLLAIPFSSMKIAVIVIGASLIYEGITDIVTMQMAGKRIEEWKKSLHP